jgi:hypothetical protein
VSMDERAVTDQVTRGAATPAGRPGSRHGASRAQSSRSLWARPRVLWAAGLAGAAVLLYWCYWRLSLTAGVNSDAAGQVLQGWEMLHGNVLLRGWILSDVSFYTFEVPLDGLTAIISGYGANTVHVAAAIVYTLLVLVAALLAKGKARGREGVVRALVAAGVLVSPGLLPGTHVLLLAPDHTGIGVPVMLTLLLIDLVAMPAPGGTALRHVGLPAPHLPRPPSPPAASPWRRWWVPVVACVMLTWAQIDDPVASFACAAPLGIVCAARAAAAIRDWRRRQATDTQRVMQGIPWYDAALVVAAAASYGLSKLALAVIRAAGGFFVHPLAGGTGLAPWSAIPTQLQWTAQNVAYLFGANYFSQSTPLHAAMGYLHLVGVAVALFGLALGVWGLFFRLSPVFGTDPSTRSAPGARGARADRVTQALALGTGITLAAGAFGTRASLVQGAHEIAIVLPLSAVLGGRLLGPWLSGVRLPSGDAGRGRGRRAAPDRPRTVGEIARVTLASVLAVAALGYMAVLGYNMSTQNYPAQSQNLADFLVAHGLTSGLGGYWNANVSTLASDGRVRVAPLYDAGSAAYPWETKTTWYDPAISYANFVVTTSYPAAQARFARPATVLAFYGKPEKMYHFSTYTIFVYNHNILNQVHQPVA